MIHITIQNGIYIRGLTDKLSKHIQKSLTLENPMYIKLLRMGNHRASYAGPKVFKFNKVNGEDLWILRGMRARLRKFLDVVGEE